VLPASEGALDALLESLPPTGFRSAPRQTAAVISNGAAAEAQELLEASREFAAERFKSFLHTEWARRGPIEFLERCVGPFMVAVGRGWAEGELEIRHEHFASGVLGDFLRTVRQPLEDRASGPVAALATLPNELHGLGLQMAALVFALSGWRSLLLGVDTPIPQIAALARDAPVAAVALSCVQERARSTTASIRALRRGMPRNIPLLVGGRGAPGRSELKGVHLIQDLSGLDHWLRSSN
jgi:methanogenic corrinoid protein MtbC1